MSEVTCKVRSTMYRNDSHTRHSWAVYRDGVAAELWIVEHPDTPYGGMEIHCSTPQEYMTHRTDCNVLGGNCWTTGSSSAAEQSVSDFRQGFLDDQLAFSRTEMFLNGHAPEKEPQ